MCNGLFTSDRTLEQVFDQELAFLGSPSGRPRVATTWWTGSGRRWPSGRRGRMCRSCARRFRKGLGCVILAPDQGFERHRRTSRSSTPPPLPGDPANIPGPMETWSRQQPLPAVVDATALEAASDWAFDRESPEQVTLSLLVVHEREDHPRAVRPGRGHVHQAPAPGPRPRASAVTLIGMLADQGKMALDEPLGFDWLPRALIARDGPAQRDHPPPRAQHVQRAVPGGQLADWSTPPDRAWPTGPAPARCRGALHRGPRSGTGHRTGTTKTTRRSWRSTP